MFPQPGEGLLRFQQGLPAAGHGKIPFEDVQGARKDQRQECRTGTPPCE